MATDQRIILKKITRTDETTFSAEGSNCSLDVECDEIGTSVTYTLGNLESTLIIAKGSLASVGFQKSSKPLWLVLSVVFAIFGLISFAMGMTEEGYVGGLGSIFLSLIFYMLYYFSKMAVLEFDSSGAQTLAFQFSGAAANRQSDMARFCRAAIMNNLGMQGEVEIGNPGDEPPIYQGSGDGPTF